MTEQELKERISKTCDKLNSIIPCKTQQDVNEMTVLLQEVFDLPVKLKPRLYWNREVWMDCGLDTDKCTMMLICTDKLCFEPSDDMQEHPGITVKYKWMKNPTKDCSQTKKA